MIQGLIGASASGRGQTQDRTQLLRLRANAFALWNVTSVHISTQVPLDANHTEVMCRKITQHLVLLLTGMCQVEGTALVTLHKLFALNLNTALWV